jgi:hypothetical protein
MTIILSDQSVLYKMIAMKGLLMILETFSFYLDQYIAKQHHKLQVNNKVQSVWLAQLVKSLAAQTHVHSCVQEVRVQSPEQTISTQDSSPPG